jgi:hypothetical protein
MSGDNSQEAVLLVFHAAPGGWVQIIIALQVQQAMNDIANQFGRPRGAEPARLNDGLVEADDDFSVQDGAGSASPVRAIFNGLRSDFWIGGNAVRRSVWFAVVESNHVRGAGVSEELVVELGHLRSGYQLESQVEGGWSEVFTQEVSYNPAQQAKVNGSDALAVAQGERAGHRVLPRCSS